jgi:hypothetical protein
MGEGHAPLWQYFSRPQKGGGRVHCCPQRRESRIPDLFPCKRATSWGPKTGATMLIADPSGPAPPRLASAVIAGKGHAPVVAVLLTRARHLPAGASELERLVDAGLDNRVLGLAVVDAAVGYPIRAAAALTPSPELRRGCGTPSTWVHPSSPVADTGKSRAGRTRERTRRLFHWKRCVVQATKPPIRGGDR